MCYYVALYVTLLAIVAASQTVDHHSDPDLNVSRTMKWIILILVPRGWILVGDMVLKYNHIISGYFCHNDVFE